MTAIRWMRKAAERIGIEMKSRRIGATKQAAHARSAKVRPLSDARLVERSSLDSMAAPDPHSLGVPRPQFPRFVQLACLVILFKRF